MYETFQAQLRRQEEVSYIRSAENLYRCEEADEEFSAYVAKVKRDSIGRLREEISEAPSAEKFARVRNVKKCKMERRPTTLGPNSRTLNTWRGYRLR